MRLVSFVVFQFLVIENCNSALSKKKKNCICAVKLEFNIMFFTCCTKVHPPLVMSLYPCGTLVSRQDSVARQSYELWALWILTDYALQEYIFFLYVVPGIKSWTFLKTNPETSLERFDSLNLRLLRIKWFLINTYLYLKMHFIYTALLSYTYSTDANYILLPHTCNVQWQYCWVLIWC